MDAKEIASLALELQTLLISHDKALTQIQLIDSKLSALTSRVFTAHITGQESLRIHLLNRKSIIEGVRETFHQYRTLKWTQIRELSTLIIETFSIDGSSLPDPPRSEAGPSAEQNDLAVAMTMAFSVCSRTV